MKKKRLLALLLSVVFAVALLSGCAATTNKDGKATPSQASPGQSLGERPLTTPESYDDVYQALTAMRTYDSPDGVFGSVRAEDMAGNVSVDSATSNAPVPQSAPRDELSMTDSGEYSKTNVQVQGVDEGDIVKTDGSYIYVLRQNELIIFKADGASTSEISSVKIGVGDNNNKQESDIYISEYASDLYVTGDTLVVITSYYTSGPYRTEGPESVDSASVDGKYYEAEYYSDKEISKLYVFDITDRSKPTLKSELGQDGSVLTTRLIDTTLYMISTYYVYNEIEGNNETFIPSLYTNGTAKLISVDSIAIMPYVNSTTFTIISAYDLTAGLLSSNLSVLGGGSTVYMNQNALYIANSTNAQLTSDPYTDSIYTVIDYTTTAVTDITSFDISDGTLSLKATGTISGSLHSQFNMDEDNGYLRVVTTMYSQSWSEYIDESKDFVNYVWNDAESSNGLTILDDDLNTVGSIQNLAPDEQVYSARFDGDIGYIVTFRQVDPLFAVDLSDPTNPTVLSELKIPGFSQYLHVWNDGRLFGLGMDADAESGRTTGMKMTMFDTTDPTDVTVKNELKLDSDTSTALYNHKAILISPEKSLIAFPADDGYDIYGYSDEQGFFKQASISSLEWYGNSRGLYIGDNAYIIDSSYITIIDMNTFKLLDKISY